MCGICGLIHTGNEVILQKMTDILHHRGPDDGGTIWFEEKRSGLGHRRLSIIDLSALGHQPMSNENGNLWITFNGEIYNYQEIKIELEKKGYIFRSRSDTEVIMKSYEEWGEHCLEKFNGMFAFAIYNKISDKLFLARDRLGIKPVYYYYKDSKFYFASEIKAFIETTDIPIEPDIENIITPTRFQITPYTGFKKIYKLPAAHYLIFYEGKITIKAYWDICLDKKEISMKEAADKLKYLLEDSVRLEMISDVPVGLMLSGGIDSSIIGALMRSKTVSNIHSFTIKFSEKDLDFEKSTDDNKYAKIVANNFNFIHHEMEVSPDIVKLLSTITYQLDEPLSDPAAINTYLIAKSARENGIVVLLNGVGGDEIFGGYRKYLACMRARNYNTLIPNVIKKIIEGVFSKTKVADNVKGYQNMRWLKRFLSFASSPDFERFIVSDLSLLPEEFNNIFLSKPNYGHTNYYLIQQKYHMDRSIDYLTRMCLNDTKVFLTEHNLTYLDKSTMCFGIESRPPLIDYRIVEYMFTLHPKFRIDYNIQKYLLKIVSENFLPSEIINRPKTSFGLPLRSWIKNDLREVIDDYLNEESVRNRGIYDPHYVRKLIEDDRSGINDHSLKIWVLLSNEIWFRTFFKKSSL